MAELVRQRTQAIRREALARAITDAAGEVRGVARHLPGDDRRAELAAIAGRIEALGARLTGTDATITVVGAVKSGKSTLVNALLGSDVLARGSGIMTARAARVSVGEAPAALARWKSAEKIQNDFRAHLEGIGVKSGDGAATLSIHSPGDRAEAANLAARSAGPHREPLEAMLEGYDAAPWREGVTVGDDPRELARYGAEERYAVYLESLELTVTSMEAPLGLNMLDSQGSDAFNAAHHAGVEESLMAADALVYVFSSRVGLRDADFRLVRTLRDYGLLDSTRFVMNVDLGEVHDAAELERLAASARRALAREGVRVQIERVSALSALISHRALYEPDGVWEGERRLLEVWSGQSGELFAMLTDNFERFRGELFEVASRGRDDAVALRVKGELRHLLVEAARVAAAAGRRGPDTDEASRMMSADTLISWAQGEVEAAVADESQRVTHTIAREFAAKASPHRKLWKDAVDSYPASPERLLAEGGGFLEAAALFRAGLHAHIMDSLKASEPVRVNGARNMALTARGNLAKAGGEIAGKLRRRLGEAAYSPAPAPTSAALARQITVTRKIPLFSSAFAETYMNAAEEHSAGARGEGVVRALAARVAGKLRGRAASSSSTALLKAEMARARLAAKYELSRRWDEYLSKLADDCLLPHVEEAASQVFAALGTWTLLQLSDSGSGALAALAAAEEAMT